MHVLNTRRVVYLNIEHQILDCYTCDIVLYYHGYGWMEIIQKR